MDQTTTTTNPNPGVTFVALPQKPQPLTRSPRDAITGVAYIDNMSFEQLRARPDLQFRGNTGAAYRRRLAALDAERAEVRTSEILKVRKARRKGKAQERAERLGKPIRTESATVGDMNVGKAQNTDEYVTVTEHAGEAPTTVDAGPGAPITDKSNTTQHSLSSFFERPVNIYDYTGTNIGITNLPVWDLWSKDPTIRAKLTNYAFFRGNMKIKISISGTPFHYGAVMASYQPYPDYNDNLSAYRNIITNSPSVSSNADFDEAYKVYLSQAPGVGYVDVKENEPLVMSIPFISHKQTFRLFNDTATVITNATSFVDFAEAGDLILNGLTLIRTANDDYFSNISVNVFAWVEDIELGATTATNIDITAESKTVKTEYSSPGPISRAASTFVSVTSLLTKVPWLGPYAKATTTLATGIGSLAALFGWSRPVVLEKPMYVKNSPFSNGANLAASETALRIVCDPKQELTVDQTIGGVSGPDDMAISSIAARESFLTNFEWTDDAVAMDTVLWRSQVCPMQYAYAALAGGVTAMISPTTLDFASRPFAYWRGTIKYKFKIVCSKFHRGKLLFKFEPNCSQAVLISANDTKLNQQNTVILDIQDSQEICLEVAWAHERAWCPVDPYLADLVPYSSTTYATLTPSQISSRAAYSNGFIEVIPLNELVQPTNTSSLTVSVFVSCDDLQLCYPTGDGLLDGLEDTHRRFNYTESKEVTCDTLNEGGTSMEGVHDYHFGERVVSFRSLLKRYQSYHSETDTTTTDGPVLWALKGNSLPWLASVIAKGTLANEPTMPGDYRNNLYNYLRPAYMGMRGGFRYRVIPLTGGVVDPSDYVRVTMSQPYHAGAASANSLGNMAANNNGALTSARSRNEGTVNFHQSSNGGVEFEVPFYSASLFLFTSSQYGYDIAAELQTGYDDYINADWTARFVINHSDVSTHPNKGKTSFIVDGVPAEDFTFLRFQGSPIIAWD